MKITIIMKRMNEFIIDSKTVEHVFQHYLSMTIIFATTTGLQ